MKASICIGCGKAYIGAKNQKYCNTDCRRNLEPISSYKKEKALPEAPNTAVVQAIPNKYTRKKWS